MAAALKAGILCFNVESEPELEVLSEVATSVGRTAPVSVRVNPDVDAKTHAKISTGKAENKFGIPLSRAREVYAAAAKLRGLRVTGVDMHIGSQIVELAPFDNAAALLAEFARTLMGDGHKLEHIDLGGGLGIPYRPDDPEPPLPFRLCGDHHAPHEGPRPEARLRDRPHDRRQCRNPADARAVCEARRGQDLRRRRCRHERPHPADAL
jgi:diaminopimelate decarboxylase